MLGALKSAGRKLKSALPKEDEPKGMRVHYADRPIPDWLIENTDESALRYGGKVRELVPNPEYEGIERQAFGQSDPGLLTSTGRLQSGNRLRAGVYRDLNMSGDAVLSPEEYYTDPKSGIAYTRQDTASLKERNMLPKEALPDRPEVQGKNRELIARLVAEDALTKTLKEAGFTDVPQKYKEELFDEVLRHALKRQKDLPYEKVERKMSQFPDQQFFKNYHKLD